MINRLCLISIIFMNSLFGQIKNLPERNYIDHNFQKISLINENVEKSKTLAFFMSLLVPGLGEYYINRFDIGKYFLISEGGLWLSLYGFDYYGRFQKNNYINYAKVNGNVITNGKDDNYWAIIGSYMNIYDYNNEKLLNRQFHLVYNENSHYWYWSTNEERKKYRSLWLSSESAFNNKQFPIALIIINHFASAINAAILAGKYNAKNEQESIQIFPQLGFDEFYNPQVKLSFLKNF